MLRAYKLCSVAAPSWVRCSVTCPSLSDAALASGLGPAQCAPCGEDLGRSDSFYTNPAAPSDCDGDLQRRFTKTELLTTYRPTERVKAGDRVKTDRRDAEKQARCHRAGDLTAVWVPDAAHEALRDLVRARLAAKRDQLRARHRLGKFLLRQGRRAPEGTTAWTGKHLAWIKQQSFEHAAQQATLLDYLHEVEHAAERIVRLERSIDVAVQSMPATQQAVISGLPARGGQSVGRDAGKRARATLAL
jgi:hypothetical protein